MFLAPQILSNFIIINEFVKILKNNYEREKEGREFNLFSVFKKQKCDKLLRLNPTTKINNLETLLSIIH